MKVVLKDESDIDANDQNSILEHLDQVVRLLHPFVFFFICCKHSLLLSLKIYSLIVTFSNLMAVRILFFFGCSVL